MRQHGRIAVIIPVYNVEQYIGECLDSVFNQTYINYDVIIINDGSTDKSLKICQKYKSNFKNCYLFSTNNIGAGLARNIGIDFAIKHKLYQWITFIDSDDCVSNFYLANLIGGALKYKTNICVGRTTNKIESLKNIETKEYETVNPDQIYIDRKGMYYYNPFAAWNKIYKIELFKQYRFPNKFHEDGFIIPQILLSNRLITISKDFTYFYRIRENSLTNSAFSNKEYDRIEALIKFVDFTIENELSGVTTYAINTLMTYVKTNLIKLKSLKGSFKNYHISKLQKLRKKALIKYNRYWKISIFDKYKIAIMGNKTIADYIKFIIFWLKYN